MSDSRPTPLKDGLETGAGPSRGAWGLLILIGLVALGMRLWGIYFGLPYDYHVDESLYRNSANLTRARISALFGPFQILVLILQKGLHLLSPLLGRLALPPEVSASLESPMSFQLLGRWSSALLGTATVIPLFLLGRRLWNETVGLMAAFFLALCFLHARSSHYGVPDATVGFFITMAAYFCTRLRPAGRVGPYLWAGLFAGLALAAKLLSWPIFVLILLFHLFPAEEEGGKDVADRRIARLARAFFAPRLVATYVLGLATFLATSPQVVLEWKWVYAYWKLAAKLGAGGGMDRLRLDDGPIWRFYLISLGWGMGWLLTVLSIAGVFLVLAQRRARPACLMLFPILYVAFIVRPGNMYFARYVLGAVPFLLLAAAVLLWTVFSRFGLRGRALSTAVAVAALLAVAQPAYDLILHDRLLEREDSRTAAKRWIERNIPEGSTVLLESWWFSPQLASPKSSVPFSERTYDVRTLGPYGLSEKAKSFGRSVGTPTIKDYADQGIEYIVTNSFTSESGLLNPEEDRAKREFYRTLDREAKLVWSLSPEVGGFKLPRIFDHTYGPATYLSRLERPGPRLAIYRLTP
jgi:hypothetical protein